MFGRTFNFIRQDHEIALSLVDQNITKAQNDLLYNELLGSTVNANPFKAIESDLANINKQIQSQLYSGLQNLDYATSYYFTGSKGKLFRPAILILLSRSISLSQQNKTLMSESLLHKDCLQWAQIIEILHTSSLVHDDMIDSAGLRRGIPVLHNKVGLEQAAFSGDYMIARASNLCTQIGQYELVYLLSLIMENLTKGEILQQAAKVDVKQSLETLFEDYYQKSYYKTASLIANCCKGVGIIHNLEQNLDDCFELGKNLGLAFQFVDDILDFIGDQSKLGKPKYNDLQEGLSTAPVLFVSKNNKWIRKAMERKFKGKGDIEKTVEIVLENEGISKAKHLALMHLQKAIQNFEFVKESEAKFFFRALAGKVFNRIFDLIK